MGIELISQAVTPETWPASLPSPASCRLSPGNAVSKRVCQSGRVEHRQFGSAPFDILDLTFRFTSAEKATFDSFFADTLENGVKWFTSDWFERFGYSSSYSARIIGYPKKGTTYSFISTVQFRAAVALSEDLVDILINGYLTVEDTCSAWGSI